MSDLLRVYYDPAEIAPPGHPHEGYPYAWFTEERTPDAYQSVTVQGVEGVLRNVGDQLVRPAIKDFIRARDGHRCLRCHHPYEKGLGQWSPCDEQCDHEGPHRFRQRFYRDGIEIEPGEWSYAPSEQWQGGPVSNWFPVVEGYEDKPPAWGCEAEYRILTVHHLNGVKHDCRWFNLVSLCQRCHLSIQTRVVMERPYHQEHSEWFKPFAAAYYANVYLGLEPTIEETQERLEEFLALERMA
jgi:hypothetical protein